MARIWQAIQRLAVNGEPSESKAEAPPTNPPRVDTKTRAAQEETCNAQQERRSRQQKAAVIAMMKRAKGATLPEIMQATSWQAHTVRGFISILGSKGGHKIQSTRNAAGERTYRATK